MPSICGKHSVDDAALHFGSYFPCPFISDTNGHPRSKCVSFPLAAVISLPLFFFSSIIHHFWLLYYFIFYLSFKYFSRICLNALFLNCCLVHFPFWLLLLDCLNYSGLLPWNCPPFCLPPHMPFPNHPQISPHPKFC